MQHLVMATPDQVYSMPMPDGSLHYINLLEATKSVNILSFFVCAYFPLFGLVLKVIYCFLIQLFMSVYSNE